jgi:hypothetical protein
MAITINHWKAKINPTLDLIIHFVFHVFKKQNIIDFMIVLKHKMCGIESQILCIG